MSFFPLQQIPIKYLLYANPLFKLLDINEIEKPVFLSSLHNSGSVFGFICYAFCSVYKYFQILTKIHHIVHSLVCLFEKTIYTPQTVNNENVLVFKLEKKKNSPVEEP